MCLIPDVCAFGKSHFVLTVPEHSKGMEGKKKAGQKPDGSYLDVKRNVQYSLFFAFCLQSAQREELCCAKFYQSSEATIM